MTHPTIDATHDASARSWFEPANGHPDFPIQNLPLGIFSCARGERRPGVAIGNAVLDLQPISALLPESVHGALALPVLNTLLAAPAEAALALRHRLFDLLSDARHQDSVERHLIPVSDVTLHIPCAIGDFTDFYVGIHHATNVGSLFRPETPLLPNYKYVPIGYHGRASSVRPTGTAVRRPRGQIKAAEIAAPTVGPCRRLDYELELGIWIGKGNGLGETIAIGGAADRIAGFCLLNDWSARDIQAWEYQPLGPFLAKSFHTTISPWVVTPAALAPFRAAQPPRAADDPPPLSYLWDDEDQRCGALDLKFEVSILSAQMRHDQVAPHRLSQSSTLHMYWTAAQIVTHHASNGCNLSAGDLIGTGTISGPDPGTYGSLLELTNGGARPITLPTGETRTFLEDGDEILFRAVAERDGFVPIGFGPCRAGIIPGPDRP